MAAPAPLDLGSSLARRKALIAKLMAQMQGQTGGGGSRRAGYSTNFAQIGQPARAGAPQAHPFTRAATEGARMGAAPANLVSTGVGEMPAGPTPGGVAVGADTRPPEQTPQGDDRPPAGEQSGLIPPSTSGGGVEPWQQQGFVSQAAFDEFNSLDEINQMRVFQNPVARARYFSGV